jgi:hypothetical protein
LLPVIREDQDSAVVVALEWAAGEVAEEVADTEARKIERMNLTLKTEKCSQIL